MASHQFLCLFTLWRNRDGTGRSRGRPAACSSVVTQQAADQPAAVAVALAAVSYPGSAGCSTGGVIGPDVRGLLAGTCAKFRAKR